MAAYPEGLREAKRALAAGEHRRAIQLCEQVRSLQRITDRQLEEIWGVLGCAHVALDEHEDGLSFLKRAARDDKTLAAVRRAYAELEIDDDPSAFFEQHEARAKKRRKRAIAIAAAAIVVLPIVLLCGGYQWYVNRATEQYLAEVEANRAEGRAMGATMTVLECVEHELRTVAGCTQEPSDPSCGSYLTVAEGCVEAAAERDDFCSEVPRPAQSYDEGSVATTLSWADDKCARWADANAELASDEELFGIWCRSVLSSYPLWCHGEEFSSGY